MARDFPPRRERTGGNCSAVDCAAPAERVAMVHARVPGEFGMQDDFTHVHFEVPICEDHAQLFRHRHTFGGIVAFEAMRD